MKRMMSFCLALAALLMASTAPAEELRVGCARDLAPMDEEQDGACVGFDADLWAAVAERLGLDYAFEPMDFEDLIPALQNGEIDAAMGAMSITSQRERVIDFSHPYFESGLIIAVRADNDDIQSINDLRGRTTATVRGSTSAQLLESLKQSYGAGNSPTFGESNIKLYADIRHALEAVRYQRADAVLFDLPMVLHYVRTKSEGTLKVVGSLYRRQFYGLAFPQGSELREMASIAILGLMESGQYNNIFAKWFGAMLFPER